MKVAFVQGGPHGRWVGPNSQCGRIVKFTHLLAKYTGHCDVYTIITIIIIPDRLNLATHEIVLQSILKNDLNFLLYGQSRASSD